MLGSLISSVVKVATLPLDLVNGGLAALDGNDPSNKEARTQIPVLGDLERIRDEACKIIKEADE